jgi:ABC-2 type transport system permease protein
MSFRRLWAVARKEFTHLLRDPRSLGMGIAIPLLLIILFGWALSLDVDRVPIAIHDQSRTVASRDLISRFEGSRYLTIVRHVDGPQGIDAAINRREVLGAVVIPTDFDRKLHLGAAEIQWVVDGSDASTAAIATGYVEAIAMRFGLEIAVQKMPGISEAPAIELRPRVWFNEEMQSRNFIIPGLIAVIMSVIAALITSLTISREWETGTMEQLISTPLRVPEMIFGKMIPYFAIGMLDVTIALIVGHWMFGVPFRGSLLLMYGVTALFLVGVLGFGLLISIVAKNQLVANQVAMVTTFLPAFLLSGFMYDISNMPPPIRLVTWIVPARYYVSFLKGVFLKGVGLEVLGFEAMMLTVFATIILVLAHLRLKKKLF